MNFDDAENLQNNYLSTLKSSFDESTVLIIDDGDISKSCSSKLEGICRVRDGSTGEITDGYWYAGVTALTAHTNSQYQYMLGFIQVLKKTITLIREVQKPKHSEIP